MFRRRRKGAVSRLAGTQRPEISFFQSIPRTLSLPHVVLRWTAAGVIEAERGFRKLAGYRALPALLAALRAHDAQLDRTEGKLDTAQDAA